LLRSMASITARKIIIMRMSQKLLIARVERAMRMTKQNATEPDITMSKVTLMLRITTRRLEPSKEDSSSAERDLPILKPDFISKLTRASRLERIDQESSLLERPENISPRRPETIRDSKLLETTRTSHSSALVKVRSANALELFTTDTRIDLILLSQSLPLTK